MSDKSHGRGREVSELVNIRCPDCYGGHFRPCQACGDSGRVNWIPNDDGDMRTNVIREIQSQLKAERAKVRKLEEAMQAVKLELNAMDGIYHKFYKSMGDPFRASQQIYCCAVKAMEAIENAMKS